MTDDRRRMLAATAATLGWLAVPARLVAQVARPLKVGFIYISPIGAAGWTYEHDQARRRMEQALPGLVQASFVEAVAEGAEAERVMRDLIAQGCQLIFATSFGYQEAVQKVAAEAPQVRFAHAVGFKTARNVSTYNARLYEARWLAGQLAGRSSASGNVGYVAGFPLPEVIQGINAFARGLRQVNPAGTVRVQWLNTWFDPAREREAALSLLGAGADVLTHHSGSAAIPTFAEERNVKVISYQSDMARFAPRNQLAAVTADWTSYYIREVRSVLAGTWRAESEWGGIKDGMVQLAAVGASVPAEVRSELARQTEALVAGTGGPFHGRLVDQQGSVRQAAGVLPDGEILTMNWLVEGVVARLPR